MSHPSTAFPVVSNGASPYPRHCPPYSFSELQSALLTKLASPSGKTKYKRYIGSPLRYAGGKSLAVGLIAELLPPSTRRVISPFIGGASIEIALANELHLPVYGFDIFDILTNYWHYQTNHALDLRHALAEFSPNRATYKSVKARLKAHWDGGRPLDGLELAAHYYFNHNTSYGPHFLGWPSDVYLNEDRYRVLLNRVGSFRAPTLHVASADFQDVIADHPNDLLYCDPPYFLDGDSKTFVGLYPHRNFPIHHNGFRHDRLRDLLHNHKGGFILSYNDCSTIREWYAGFNMSTPSWQYTFSQGDTRIGTNRLRDNNGSHVKKSHELLIWKLPKK